MSVQRYKVVQGSEELWEGHIGKTGTAIPYQETEWHLEGDEYDWDFRPDDLTDEEYAKGYGLALYADELEVLP